MAYSQTLQLVQGDTLPQIKVTIRDQNTAAPGRTLDAEDPTSWAVVDLTGCSVRMRIRQIGSTTVKDTLTAVISAPALGEAIFQPDADTLDTAGDFEAEIEYTTLAGNVQTVYELIRLKVREQF